MRKNLDFMMGKLGRFGIVLVFLMFCGCADKEDPYIYEKYVDEIIHSFAADMKKEYGLVCDESGGRMPHDVEQISISFCCYRRATVEEARELFVTVTEKFIDKINKHEKIRPFLREYPFTFRPADESFTWCRADVSIAFYKKEGSHYLDESVTLVGPARDGNIAYRKSELQRRKLPDIIELDGSVEVGDTINAERYVTFMREYYEEAIRIVHEERENKI